MICFSLTGQETGEKLCRGLKSAGITATLDKKSKYLPDWFTHGFMGLVNCLCFAFVVIGVTWVMEKLHVKLKI